MEKIYKKMDVKWTAEEQMIFQKAIDLCYKCAEDDDLEDWAQENCSKSFVDVGRYLQEFINNSI